MKKKAIFHGYAFVHTYYKDGESKQDVIAQFGDKEFDKHGCIGFAQGYFTGWQESPDYRLIYTTASPSHDGWVWWHKNKHSDMIDELWQVKDKFGNLVK